MLSSRSGTVTKAKDPARAMMRGKAMKRSLGERLIKDELLDIEDMLGRTSEVSEEGNGPMDSPSSLCCTLGRECAVSRRCKG